MDLKNTDVYRDGVCGHLQEQGPDRRIELNQFNEKLTENVGKSLRQPPLLEGMGHLNQRDHLLLLSVPPFAIFVQLYTFGLIIGVLFMEVEDQAALIYAGLFIFLPQGFIVGLDVLVVVGKILCITDEDLRIFWFGCFGLCGTNDRDQGNDDETVMTIVMECRRKMMRRLRCRLSSFPQD